MLFEYVGSIHMSAGLHKNSRNFDRVWISAQNGPHELLVQIRIKEQIQDLFLIFFKGALCSFGDEILIRRERYPLTDCFTPKQS